MITQEKETLENLVSFTREVYQKQLNKIKDKSESKRDIEKISWIIFWLYDWLELLNKWKLEEEINKFRDTFFEQKNIFLIWRLEWLTIVYRIHNNDKDMLKIIKKIKSC